MKEMNEEKIQMMLENGTEITDESLSAFEKDQVKSYQSLYQQLKAEPQQGLPFNFASKVTAQLKLQLKRKSDIRFNLLAALGIIFGLAAVYGLLTLVSRDAGSQFLAAVIRYKWMLILGSVMLLGTLIFDQAKVEKVA